MDVLKIFVNKNLIIAIFPLKEYGALVGKQVGITVTRFGN